MIRLNVAQSTFNLGPAQTLFPNGGQSISCTHTVPACCVTESWGKEKAGVFMVRPLCFHALCVIGLAWWVCLPFSALSLSPTTFQAPSSSSSSSSSSRLETPDSYKRWALCVCISSALALTCSPFLSDLSPGSKFLFSPSLLFFLAAAAFPASSINQERRTRRQRKRSRNSNNKKKDALTSQYE